MDKGTLYELALACLGERQYRKGTESQDAIDRVVQHCISLALDYAPWTFAARRVVLPLVDDACELPHDCLRLHSVSLPLFRLVGRVLHSQVDAREVEIVYTSDECAQAVFVPDGQPAFAEAVVLLLASKVAPKLTGDFRLAQQLELKARSALGDAKLKDARQVGSNDQLPRPAVLTLD